MIRTPVGGRRDHLLFRPARRQEPLYFRYKMTGALKLDALNQRGVAKRNKKQHFED